MTKPKYKPAIGDFVQYKHRPKGKLLRGYISHMTSEFLEDRVVHVRKFHAGGWLGSYDEFRQAYVLSLALTPDRPNPASVEYLTKRGDVVNW